MKNPFKLNIEIYWRNKIGHTEYFNFENKEILMRLFIASRIEKI